MRVTAKTLPSGPTKVLRGGTFLAALVILTGATYCRAQTRKNACTKYDETHLDACASGRNPVWAYDTSDPAYGTVQNGGYRTAEKAQHSRNSEKDWCDYWTPILNHRVCQTTYSEVYCAACASGASSNGSLQPEQEVWLEKSNLLLSRWELQSALALRTFSKNNPSMNPYANMGSVLSDYSKALRDATKDVMRLRRALQPLYGGISSFSSDIQSAISALEEDENRVQTAQARYQQALQPAQIAYQSSSQTWSQQHVDVNGQQTTQSIGISGDSVEISQKDMNGSSQTYLIPKTDLRGSNTAIRQQGRAWVLSIVMPRRTAKLTINSGSSNDQEVVSRFELFFASEADAQAAAQSLAGR